MDSGKRVCPNTRYPRPDNLQPLSRNLQAKKSPFHCSLTSFEMGFSHWVDSHRKTSAESICFLTRPIFCCLQSVPICFERYSFKILYLAWGHNLILVGVFVSSWLLVSEIPMFALKFKQWGWKGNEVKYIFLITCIPLIAIFGISSFAIIIAWYVILSVIVKPSSVKK